jgi:hypothetical protein
MNDERFNLSTLVRVNVYENKYDVINILPNNNLEGSSEEYYFVTPKAGVIGSVSVTNILEMNDTVKEIFQHKFKVDPSKITFIKNGSDIIPENNDTVSSSLKNIFNKSNQVAPEEGSSSNSKSNMNTASVLPEGQQKNNSTFKNISNFFSKNGASISPTTGGSKWYTKTKKRRRNKKFT